jgi:hypothetical protein
MTTLRRARAGTNIVLRAKITDDVGAVATASGVYTLLYGPDATVEDKEDPGLALHSGNPTYWTDGIYELPYSIPADAEGGTWSDLWFATLNGQELEGEFAFEILADAVVLPVDSQLPINSFVDVTVASGVWGLDGSLLEEPFEFTFMTTISPAYTDINKVKLETGAAIPRVTDDTISTAILEASIEADFLNWAKTNLNDGLFQHARREWTTCRAASMLAVNAKSSMLVLSKSLADLRVSYNPAALDDLLGRIRDCLSRWELELISGGRAVQTPGGVIKGEWDPDRPAIGRDWLSTDWGSASQRLPIGNRKVQPVNSRRIKKTARPARIGRR